MVNTSVAGDLLFAHSYYIIWGNSLKDNKYGSPAKVRKFMLWKTHWYNTCKIYT